MKSETKGKFIVIYGSNNTGKTTQIKMIYKKLISLGAQVACVKYPIYDINNDGYRIWQYLRKEECQKENLNSTQFQELCAKNRRDFEPILVKMLEAGIYVIAEEYVGTGIAWGMTQNVPYNKLIKMNKGLYEPDLSILLDGEIIHGSVEKGHRFTDTDAEVLKRNRQIHRDLAQKYNWEVVNADRNPVEVFRDICYVMDNYLIKFDSYRLVSEKLFQKKLFTN